VKRLGRKGWDDSHQLCLDAVIYLFQHDTTTTAFNSLHLVRLISRLVRARGFAVRPEVISALLNLRLKEELGGGRIRASASAVFREREGKHGAVRWNKEKNHKGRKGGKAKEAMSKKGSKKARQARKEQEAVEKEMREAEGAINQEERERNQTETLKLLFALYFRIVKLDYRSPLLPAALEGLARFAHLVNIDFFRDLLECLKGIVYRGTEQAAKEDSDDDDFVVDSLANAKRNDMREKLLCIVTAFELLQGQGVYLAQAVCKVCVVLLTLTFRAWFRRRVPEHRPRRLCHGALCAHPPSLALADDRGGAVSGPEQHDARAPTNAQARSDRGGPPVPCPHRDLPRLAIAAVFGSDPRLLEAPHLGIAQLAGSHATPDLDLLAVTPDPGAEARGHARDERPKSGRSVAWTRRHAGTRRAREHVLVRGDGLLPPTPRREGSRRSAETRQLATRVARARCV
jgi:hypothetical protein